MNQKLSKDIKNYPNISSIKIVLIVLIVIIVFNHNSYFNSKFQWQQKFQWQLKAQNVILAVLASYVIWACFISQAEKLWCLQYNFFFILTFTARPQHYMWSLFVILIQILLILKQEIDCC